jgi:hypothetical protein
MIDYALLNLKKWRDIGINKKEEKVGVSEVSKVTRDISGVCTGSAPKEIYFRSGCIEPDLCTKSYDRNKELQISFWIYNTKEIR